MTDESEVVREFSRTAPNDLKPPSKAVDADRGVEGSEDVLDQGFARDQIGPEWWARHGIEIQFPSTVEGQQKLTRRDLFSMGSTAETDSDFLTFVWHVLAWGSGVARRNNLKRIGSCRDNVKVLSDATRWARDGEVRAAYRSLIRRGTVPYLGPAFFTKILYFASNQGDPRCLILDARVARSLYRMGWSMAPSYPSRSFSFNWYTDTYVSYCELLARWADAAQTRPDVFERRLFDEGKDEDQRR